MTLSELQRALNEYGVACWFSRLPAHERSWENRVGAESVRLQLRDRALAAGASTEQITDADRYASDLVNAGRVPLGLSNRSWEQFTADQRAQL